MKPRARRLTSAAACLTAGVIVVFVVLNWSTVRDHVEAWHFQLTRETVTYEPRTLTLSERWEGHFEGPCFQILSTYSNRDVILDTSVEREYRERWVWVVERSLALTAEAVLREFRGDGWRILEQRFPRSAYIVIATPDSLEDVVPRKIFSSSPADK